MSRATAAPGCRRAAQFALRGAVVRVRTASVRTDPRTVVACAILTVVCALLLLLSVSFGEVTIGLPDAFAAIVGNGSSANEFFVNTLRLPRALSGLLAGVAFGLSGAIFQTIARNPLASPDIIGITAGASAAAVAVVVWVGTGAGAVTLGALAGALVTALAMYVLALRGGVDGYRLVLVGIGLGAMLSAITAYLLTRISIVEAQYAFIWLIGQPQRPVVGAGPAARRVPRGARAARADARALRAAARARRRRPGSCSACRSRARGSRCCCSASRSQRSRPRSRARSASSPWPRRRSPAAMVRSPHVTLVASALVGAVMVSASDLAGRVLPSVEVPVGVVTGIVGAPYLLWLLVRGHRNGELG